MKCLEDQKVQCVVFVLTDEAHIWRQTAERMIGVGVEPMMWE